MKVCFEFIASFLEDGGSYAHRHFYLVREVSSVPRVGERVDVHATERMHIPVQSVLWSLDPKSKVSANVVLDAGGRTWDPLDFDGLTPYGWTSDRPKGVQAS